MRLGMDQTDAEDCSCEAMDHFDLLPDSILLLIFNQLGDVKALGRCCAVSKRFHGLAPQVNDVLVKVDCVISGEETSLNAKGKSFLSCFMRLFLGNIVKPLQALQHWMAPKKSTLTQISHHSPREVLKNFNAITRLRIELPAGELGVEKGVLLKWKAEFGSTLERCTILGAASCVKKERDQRHGKTRAGSPNLLRERTEEALQSIGGGDDNGSLPESFYTDGGLKLRVVWTISSLIAASARHFLLRQIISDHPSLETLILTDSDGQGVLCMSKSQLREFCEKPCAASPCSSRTQVPALSMRLCYAPYLELPGGTSLEGATLVTIKPVDQPTCKDADQFVAEAFEEPYRSAVGNLMKRKTYLLEMNSF
ncbi:hypothetical protein O6H91_23G040100 [Diphasiastrum complanatum]|uniref:Uncharacterized protein n=3 Tax=Diphasiastrum complanatum TaxID=34168 RepID=A0ACC2ABV8_DIPCM|nr:hypothetical protein O6H91_23G040100 [Diphasiastrum complanatum]KAJ7514344.1 hypothetical protein O6H91_23G040100 [Diphasiastrum complanatum]KAJ7514345.1 hypothetical protein O6H91_23G040100 [Diphasiastrum complanatum]